MKNSQLHTFQGGHIFVAIRYLTSILAAFALTHPSLAASYELEDHVKACEAELGEIPAIDCFDPEHSVEVPITVQGQPVAFLDWNAPPPPEQCDQPVGLVMRAPKGSCIPYNRAGRIDTAVGTTWFFVCRRYFARPPDSPIFDEVNVIGVNREAVCFLNTYLNHKPPHTQSFSGTDPGRETDTSKWLQPKEDEDMAFWMSPSTMAGEGSCLTCHNANPILRSPLFSRLKIQEKSYFSGIKFNGGAKRVISGEFFTSKAPKKWRPTTQPVSHAPCLTCHNVSTSSQTYCEYAKEAWGRKSFVLNITKRTLPSASKHAGWHSEVRPPAPYECWEDPKFQQQLDAFLTVCKEASSGSKERS